MELKEYYDKMYGRDGDFWPSNPEYYIKKYISLLSSSSNIVDLGCGEGRNLKYLRSLGYKNLSGVDFSQKGLDKLNEKYKDIVTVCAHVEEEVLKLNEIDCFICNHVAHFISNDENREKFFTDMMEKTKINGFNFVSVMIDDGDYDGFDKGELLEIYESEGWDVIAYREYYGEYEDQDDGVGEHRHYMAEIVAKKK